MITWESRLKNLAYLAAALFFGGLLLLMIFPKTADAAVTLSLEECLALAEQYHPNLAGAAAQIETEQGRLEQSVVPDRLTVTGDASTSRIGTRDDEKASYSAGASANVKIFDANCNKYAVDAQRNTLSATEAQGEQTLQDVRSEVKQAYMALLLNMEIAEQRRESVRAFEHHLEQARGFYEAGSKPWYDVTKAEVDLGNAQLSLVEADANVQVAKEELQNAIGVTVQGEFNVIPTSLRVPPETEREALPLALEGRADYQAAALKVLAGVSTIQSELRSSSPSISLAGGYNADGDDIFDLGKGWNVGVKVSIPIVDGGEKNARVRIAQGQLSSLEATQEKLKQDIVLEVSRALSGLQKAREGIRISELTLVSAEENRRMAQGRYETGVGDPLEVTDALLSLTDAQLAVYQARHDLQAAFISLERATGIDFPVNDVAEGSGE